MGWTSFNMKQPVKQWFTENWNSDKAEVLEVAVVKRNTLFAAIREKENNKVFCAVYLLRWSKGYYNFSYKDMSEFAGPYQYECPEKVFNLLTPLEDTPENQLAIEWRKKVQEFYKSREQMKTGDFVYKTEKPIHFSNGKAFQFFKKIGRKMYGGELIENEFKYICRVGLNINHYKFELQLCKIV